MLRNNCVKQSGFAALLTLSTALVLPAAVQAATFDKADTDIAYRQAAFSMIAINLGDMADMVKGKKVWDEAAFQQRAAQLAQLAPMAEVGFQAADSQHGDTQAKTAVWTDNAEFAAQFKQFINDTDNLAAVAQQGDSDQMKKAFGQAAKNCKACHNNFKEK